MAKGDEGRGKLRLLNSRFASLARFSLAFDVIAVYLGYFVEEEDFI